MDRYQKIEKNGEVGSGTYGVVYKAKDRQSGDFVALKRIRLEVEDEGIPSTTLREISVLRQLKHPNIVELSDVIQSEGRLYLVFEFVDKDLKKYMDSVPNTLDPMLVKVVFCTHVLSITIRVAAVTVLILTVYLFLQSYLYQMLRGLHFCHARGVMHRSATAALAFYNGRI